MMTDITADKKHSRTVRKTLTIDGDLAIEIQNFIIEKGVDEKTVINDLLRLGLISEQNRQTKVERFQLPSFNKGIGEISRAELNKMLDEV
jgi:hypothetical protein